MLELHEGVSIARKSQKNAMKKRNNSSSIPRSVSVKDKEYRFKRTWALNITMNESTGFLGAGFDLEFNFALSQSNVNIGGVGTYGPTLPNSSEFSNLFDQFCIKGVRLTFYHSQNEFVVSSPSIVCPLFTYVVDYDDSNACVLTDLLQYPNVKTHSMLANGTRPLVTRLKPRPLLDVAGTGLLTSYAPSLGADTWISTSYATTPHYGLKLVWNTFGRSSNTDVGTLTVYCEFDLAFRHPK